MPFLEKLAITGLRNIQATEINPGPGFNLLIGKNGSGKTSILEAIHLLALGRSFRSHLQKPLIQEGLSETTVYGMTDAGLGLGIQKPLRGAQLIHIAGRKVSSLAELSHCLPLQLINSDTFQILEGGPAERRRFLDWGVFHVEQNFLSAWRRTRAALQQRNSLLKADAPGAELEPWTQELVRSAELMHQYREAYLEHLREVLDPILAELEDNGIPSSMQMRYERGWDAELGLKVQLQESLLRDRKYGFTTAGPHKAEIHFRTGKFNVTEVLSRGQLKLLVCALKLAQGKLLAQMRGQQCIYLLDDLPAELDDDNRRKVCALLAEQSPQAFLSAIDASALEAFTQAGGGEGGLESKLFHVKHGTISS